MKTKEKRQKRFFILLLLLSILLHFIFLVLPLSLIPKKEIEEKPFVVERLILDDDGQVVDQVAEANKEKPKDSKFLSEFDNKVKKETKAPMVAEPHRAQRPAPPQIAKQGETDQKKGKDTALTIKDKSAPPKPTWEELTALTPQQERMQPSRPSSSDDYLPDTDIGDETNLNTKEFMFYTYFARIKERLRMYWTPALQAVLNKIYYGGQNVDRGEYITKVQVTLARDGSLQRIKVLQGSGNAELDLVAVQAFERAAPFPNPPSGMIEKDGTVKLRWDFVLTANSGPNLRLLLSRKN
jgi:TonB family protein